MGRGRYPHQGFFRSWSADDDAAVQRALEATETLELAERNVDELSGGQRQRVWIAMALAQETEVLLLDEPTTYLDLAHQVEVLDLVTDLNRQRGTTVAIVLHDLNLAARYADHVIAMKGGRIVAVGAPSDVVTEDLVRDVFGLDSRVIPDPVSGTPLIIPLGRHHTDFPKAETTTWSSSYDAVTGNATDSKAVDLSQARVRRQLAGKRPTRHRTHDPRVRRDGFRRGGAQPQLPPHHLRRILPA